MKILEKYKEENLIFYDLESVRCEKKLTPKSKMYDAWLYKARNQNEVLKKTGEQVTPEEYFESKAALYAPFAFIACIVAGRIVNDQLSVKVYSGKEFDLLTSFNNDMAVIHEANPMTSLVGWMSDGFDSPFIFKRSLINKVKPHTSIDTGDTKPWELQSIDLGKLFKQNSFYPDSMMAVAAAMGLPNPKKDMSGADVSNAYYAGKTKEIAEYCTGDVLTTANLYRSFLNKPLVTLK